MRIYHCPCMSPPHAIVTMPDGIEFRGGVHHHYDASGNETGSTPFSAFVDAPEVVYDGTNPDHLPGSQFVADLLASKLAV